MNAGERLIEAAANTRTVARLIQAADECRDLIDRTGIVCACHVVLPDRRLDRQPWVEIRTVQLLGVDLEEQIETTWPDVEFEVVHVDEDDL